MFPWRIIKSAIPSQTDIHTERPEEDWWDTYSATIGNFFAHRKSLTLLQPVVTSTRSRINTGVSSRVVVSSGQVAAGLH